MPFLTLHTRSQWFETKLHVEKESQALLLDFTCKSLYDERVRGRLSLADQICTPNSKANDYTDIILSVNKNTYPIDTDARKYDKM